MFAFVKKKDETSFILSLVKTILRIFVTVLGIVMTILLRQEIIEKISQINSVVDILRLFPFAFVLLFFVGTGVWFIFAQNKIVLNSKDRCITLRYYWKFTKTTLQFNKSEVHYKRYVVNKDDCTEFIKPGNIVLALENISRNEEVILASSDRRALIEGVHKTFLSFFGSQTSQIQEECQAHTLDDGRVLKCSNTRVKDDDREAICISLNPQKIKKYASDLSEFLAVPILGEK